MAAALAACCSTPRVSALTEGELIPFLIFSIIKFIAFYSEKYYF